MDKKKVILITIWFFIFIFLTFFLFSFFKNYGQLTGFATYSEQPDEASGKDTYIKENPVVNYGTATTMKIGKTESGDEDRALLEFNLSSIPSGDTIVLSNLQIYAESSTASGNITLKIYRITEAWEETSANWTYKTNSEIWWDSGGDYNSNMINAVNFTNSSGVYYNFTITSLVSGWVNETYDNYGLIITSSDASNGDLVTVSSSSSATEAQRPLFFIDHSPNSAPTITNLSTNTNSSDFKNTGEQITFTITWTDLESDTTQLFICNTSEANASGCTNKTFCSTSLALTNPSSCDYTVTTNENRTTNFWAFVCDGNNCSTANASQFYTNQFPTVEIKQPNGGETINQSSGGNYDIQFNISDADSDNLFADFYYGTTQNSTTNLINSSVNLTDICTITGDDTATTPNNCQYAWNTTGIYGTYYLTILVNDSYALSNDSSDASFDIRSSSDNTAPNVTSPAIDSGIYSGKTTTINATIEDESAITAWADLNYTSTNVTMTNTSATLYTGSFTAPKAGTYQYKIYASDPVGNLNHTTSWQEFNVTKPNATTQNLTAPSTALPYHTIKVTGQLNATQPVTNASGYLNIPDGFTFLSDYPQLANIGDLPAGQTGTATWFLSTPLTESTYTLNITFSDQYSNEWNISNTQVQVTSAVGGGYEISMTGYPEVETGSNYYAEAYFKQSGAYTDPDSITISLYNPLGALTVGPIAMTKESTGIYNYTRNITSGNTEGQWETIVNATKSLTSYYTHEFWKVVGGPFDVRTVTILDSTVNELNISFIAENTGGADKDLILTWDLTRVDTDASLNSGGETRMVPANSEITWYINPSTTYVGQVKITILGYYSGTEKAGAYKIFSTTAGTYCGDGTCNGAETCSTCPGDCGVCAPSTPSTGGGSSSVSITPTPVIPVGEEYSLEVQNFEKEIFLAQNIEKIISITINNTGTKELTNISLSIENLDESYYTIIPSTINSIKSGETKEFAIKFIVAEILGEIDTNYKITANELTKQEPVKITILELKGFFINEFQRIMDWIKTLEQELQGTDLLDDLEECKEIANNINTFMEKEEFINVQNYLPEAEECLKKIEDKKDKLKKEPLFDIKMTENLWWIITWGLIIILIAILIFIVYLIYKKTGVLKFLKTEGKNASEKTDKQEPKKLQKEFFEDKIKKIEEKLK